MAEFFQNLFTPQNISMFLEGTLVTLKVTFAVTFLSYIIGIPLGVLLYCTSQGSIFPNKPVNAILGFIVNVLRSIPFVILLLMTQPLAKIVVGSLIGDNTFIFHLVLAAAPFVARMIESSLKEVDSGVIEAAQAMGSNNFQIITKVLIPDAIAITTILGYTPMAYLIAGGGLGQIAIQYGLYRHNYPIMYVASLLLIILVQVIQEVLSHLAKKSDKRIRGK